MNAEHRQSPRDVLDQATEAMKEEPDSSRTQAGACGERRWRHWNWRQSFSQWLPAVVAARRGGTQRGFYRKEYSNVSHYSLGFVGGGSIAIDRRNRPARRLGTRGINGIWPSCWKT